MNETDYQELYLKFIESSDEKIRKKCIEKLHQIVYVYPIKRFQCSADIASDFYSYFFDKIEAIFQDFDPQIGVNFAAFVSIRLKYGFINFSRRQKHTIVEDQYDPASLQDLQLYHQRNDEIEQNSTWAAVRNKIRHAIATLIGDEQLSLLLLYCFPLQLSHFRDLLRKHQNFGFFAEYRRYLMQITEWQIKDKKNKEKIFTQLRQIEKLLQTADSQEQSKLEKRRTYYGEKLYSVSSPISLKQVAQLMKEGVSYVFRRIKNAKNKLKRLLLNDFNIFEPQTL